MLFTSLLVGCDQLSPSPTYSLFDCKNVLAKNEEECNRTFKGTVEFKVNKDKSDVILVFTDPTTKEQNIKKLESCAVIDVLNWQCGKPFETEIIAGDILSSTENSIYRSTNGNITISDFRYSLRSMNGGSSTTVTKAGILKRN